LIAALRRQLNQDLNNIGAYAESMGIGPFSFFIYVSADLRPALVTMKSILPLEFH
jgi:hypothetical protein